MRVDFDRKSNSAYIYFKDDVARQADRQVLVDEKPMRGMIVLDFDQKGRLVGLDVMNATRALPQELLDRAERI